MAFAKARTALAQLEEKLRRQLGLAGEVGASFQPQLTPVLIAGDLREAGNAANHGRAFSWCRASAVAANQGFSLRPEADIYIDQLFISSLVAGLIHVYLTAPNETTGVAVASLQGTWVDRKTVGTDQVPLTGSANWGAFTGTTVTDQNRIVAVNLQANGAVVIPVNIMLVAGSALNWQNNPGANTPTIGIRGRIWP